MKSHPPGGSWHTGGEAAPVDEEKKWWSASEHKPAMDKVYVQQFKRAEGDAAPGVGHFSTHHVGSAPRRQEMSAPN